MSAQSFEDLAFNALKNNNRLSAVNLLRHGAKISLGRGRASRMRDWASALEHHVRGFDYYPGDTSFLDLDKRAADYHNKENRHE